MSKYIPSMSHYISTADISSQKVVCSNLDQVCSHHSKNTPAIHSPETTESSPVSTLDIMDIQIHTPVSLDFPPDYSAVREPHSFDIEIITNRSCDSDILPSYRSAVLNQTCDVRNNCSNRNHVADCLDQMELMNDKRDRYSRLAFASLFSVCFIIILVYALTT